MVVPTRRPKAQSRNAMVSFVGATAVGLLLLGTAHWRFRPWDLHSTHRVWIPPNQRLRMSGEDRMAFTTRIHREQPNENVSSHSPRYLIFRPPLETAQGVGNLMNGLLAAHLLGVEFDRIVCVSSEWQDFTAAFESLDGRCRNQDSPLSSHTTTLWLLNFSKLPVNECQLKHRLQGPESIITLVANTYPQWPTHTIQLEDWYRPKFSVPWSHNPLTVVHLRQADNAMDSRAGMDQGTFTALGATLPRDTHLVTNQVDLYNYFETNFGWSHPTWTGIHHSAISNIQWTTSTQMNRREQVMQLWVDWWTIYKAQTVYHTHSDFSRSATRWSRTESSYTITGVDPKEGSLLLTQDVDGAVVPLRERSQLQHCELTSSGLDGLGYVMDLDDHIHDDLMDDWKKPQPVSDPT